MSTNFCTIEVSTDGSYNYRNMTTHDIGNAGEDKRVRRHRMGSPRKMVVRIRVTSPVKRDLLTGVVRVESEQ